MEKLVGQEITCRITKLDVTDEDVVVDRRAILEEQALSVRQDRYSALKEGDIVRAKSAVSQATERLWISAVSMACCMSATFRGVV